MAIPEHQLATWSNQGAVQTSADTYQTIKRVLEDPSSPFYSKTFDVFLQGSYGNNTNIYADSDVDIVICLTSTYYSDTSKLSVGDKRNWDVQFSRSSYQLADFKRDVLNWLRQKYGGGVREGNKAIFIPGSGNRRDADVLVCAEYRFFHNYTTDVQSNYTPGITFWTSTNQQIVNYPKQHRTNCTSKNTQTGQIFKPMVRVLKNMRNAMCDAGYISKGDAPSYFLEGLLWNVPASLFSTSLTSTFSNSFVHIANCDRDGLLCANGIHWLVRDGHSVCWNSRNFEKYKFEAIRFWNDW